MDMDDDMSGMGGMEKNFNFPAVFVVNGESNSISVIRMSDNVVVDSIALAMPGMGSMGMWPHHISLYSSGNSRRLAVALPGMDLSAGHGGQTGGMAGALMVLDAEKGTMQKSLSLPDMNHNATFSPDGSEIWTSQMNSGKVLVYDAQTYALKNTITVGADPAEVTFSSGGSKAYVANGGDDNVMVINPASKTVTATIPVGDEPVAAWVGFDGKMYVDNEMGETVSVIDVATNAVVQTISLGFMPGSVAHNLQKNELWVTDPDNGKVHYWNRSGNQWVHGGVFDAAAGAHAVAFTADGTVAYVTNQMARSVSVINVNTHSKIRDVAVGLKPNGILIKN
ncbi:hypothetical protein GCM10023184_38770 [Flaviaesturariibacter amylovorans]|uniref:YncE family protein n=2 Tax=Flaviaesturariibacter amylovorans TaxID=1084520 RepID=A0ABP8HKZ8_9BACT